MLQPVQLAGAAVGRADRESRRSSPPASDAYSVDGLDIVLCLGSAGARTVSDSGCYVNSRAAGRRRPRFLSPPRGG
jgi:hypothetical protein